MSNRLNRSNLQVSEALVKFIENEALPNTGVNSEVFWSELEAILDKFVPQNNNNIVISTHSIIKLYYTQYTIIIEIIMKRHINLHN